MRLARVLVLALGLMLALGACSSAAVEVSLDEQIAERAVEITTTACGAASGTSGAGVIVGTERVLTAAHVIIGASSLSVRSAHPEPNEQPGDLIARVMAIDIEADLALVEVPGLAADSIALDPIVLGDADRGDVLRSAGGGTSGPLTTEVLRRVDVRIEGVRSTERGSRLGYEIDRRIDLGDSGGGLFNQQGQLVAILYGRSQTRDDASFAVRRGQIEELLASGDDDTFKCDPFKSRIVPE